MAEEEKRRRGESLQGLWPLVVVAFSGDSGVLQAPALNKYSL